LRDEYYLKKGGKSLYRYFRNTNTHTHPHTHTHTHTHTHNRYCYDVL